MAGNRGKGRPAGVAARIRSLLAETADLATEDLERRAKALTSLARSEQSLAELQQAGADAHREEVTIDDAAEGALRDQLLRRMVALEAEILAQPGGGATEG